MENIDLYNLFVDTKSIVKIVDKDVNCYEKMRFNSCDEREKAIKDAKEQAGAAIRKFVRACVGPTLEEETDKVEFDTMERGEC